MRTYLECIPCFVRQALDAVRFVTDDEAVHADVLRQVLRAAADMDMSLAPPAMGHQIHSLIRRLTGQADPYLDVKERFNRFALGLYPEMKTRVERATDPLETAARLAIAGNIIDFGVTSTLDEATVHETIERAMSEPLCGSVDGWRDVASEARDILFLADNAGEIVFDRVLIEALPSQKVTVVVKGGPVFNDATMDDARTAGMTELVPRLVSFRPGDARPGHAAGHLLRRLSAAVRPGRHGCCQGAGQL